jgi:hypothetical protein
VSGRVKLLSLPENGLDQPLFNLFMRLDLFLPSSGVTEIRRGNVEDGEPLAEHE